MSESFASLFEESLQRTEMRPGEVITAEVVRVEHNFVVVNAGLKSEAYVPIDEFKNDQEKSKSRWATLCRSPSARSKTATATPSCRATPPSAWPRGWL